MANHLLFTQNVKSDEKDRNAKGSEQSISSQEK